MASDGTKLEGHYYERKKNAPLVIFFHGFRGHSYVDGVPIYKIAQKENGMFYLSVCVPIMKVKEIFLHWGEGTL